MGYDKEQLDDLRATLDATNADVVVSATPLDLSRLIRLEKPIVRVRYAYADAAQAGGSEATESALARWLDGFLRAQGLPASAPNPRGKDDRTPDGCGCARDLRGRGGIPVVVTPSGGLQGVEAVIDKDLTTAILAEKVRADQLLLLTNVDAVYADWPSPCERAIRRAHPDALAALDFESGSMGPKVEAAVAFARRTGKPACIGALEEARRVFLGEAGTRISSEESGLLESRSDEHPTSRPGNAG